MLDETQKEKKNFFKNEKGIITVEVINRFKGLDLTECLKHYGRRFMTLYRGQGSRPSHMNCGKILVQFSSVTLFVSNSLRPHGLQHTRPACPSPTPRVYSKLMSIESVMPSNYLILCRPLLLLPSIFPRIRVFSNKSVLHIRWPKYRSFSFNICPSMKIQN